ncbi:hypothetical protein, partial [Sutterella wadsworthensis]|uniref:hypothetical protein n=1 Tax=Sutterella wadsworthensis TaxID=40545 RepID=UPI00307A4A88
KPGFKNRRIAKIDADQYKYGSAIREFRRPLEAGNSAPAGCAAVFGSKQAPAFICRCHQHVETCVTFCCTP